MKRSEFNIILFLFLYFFIKYGFYFYIGLATPGGNVHISFLEQYANIPYWITLIASDLSALSLKLFGYEVHQYGADNVTIAGSKGVTIAWGCLGIGAIGLWIAFIVAHKAKVKFKLKWILAGVVAIYLINIIRIDMIALSNHYNWKYLQSFNAHESFDILSYAVILVFMLVFILIYKKNKIKIKSGSA
ncbi:MAG: archaeosortase/exosortase family protein [Bacteroidetes bacterium]|nr:archaeosortase/exosortase family protein [Bacteroidota bacterium]